MQKAQERLKLFSHQLMEVKKQPSMFTISKVDILTRKILDEKQGLSRSSSVLQSSSPKHVEKS